MDTAAGIVKAVAASPLTGGLPFTAIVAGIGAAQAAFVAAQPLPQFKDGVRNFEGGLAVINDAPGTNFREIAQLPDGSLLSPKERNTVVNLPKGSNVYTADESQNMMDNINRSVFAMNMEAQGRTIDNALMIMNFDAGMARMTSEVEKLNANFE